MRALRTQPAQTVPGKTVACFSHTFNLAPKPLILGTVRHRRAAIMEESPSPPSPSPPSLAHLRLHGTPPGLEKGSLSLKKVSTSSLSATRTPRINRKVEKRRDAFGLGSGEVSLQGRGLNCAGMLTGHGVM